MKLFFDILSNELTRRNPMWFIIGLPISFIIGWNMDVICPELAEYITQLFGGKK